MHFDHSDQVDSTLSKDNTFCQIIVEVDNTYLLQLLYSQLSFQLRVKCPNIFYCIT